MHIALEGLDGVGKTHTAKILEKDLGLTLIEMPLHYLTDLEGRENYLRLTNYINDNTNSDFTAMFYGTGNFYLKFLIQGRNVITDRHIGSTYFWNYNGRNLEFFNYLVKVCGKPDLTVILLARAEVRRQRIFNRNPNDVDLKTKIFPDDAQNKLIEFVNRYSMNHICIDNSDLTPQETADLIAKAVREQKLLP